MAGDFWTEEEIKFLKENCNKSCNVIAKELNRTTKSVQHKFNQLGLEKPRARVGDIVKGWKIESIFSKNIGSQNVNMAKIKSTLADFPEEREVRLTYLTNEQIAYPGRKRPDLSIKNTTHGQSRTRLHKIWMGMKSRCYNKNQSSYERYGKRGITICDEWLNDFRKFKEWSDSNGYSDELTLDRKENDKGYYPDNCRWATGTQQISNRSNSIKLDFTAFNQTKNIYEWLNDERCKVRTISALLNRIKSGKLTPEEIISNPSERQHKLSIKNWIKEKYPEIYKEYGEYVA